MRAGIPFRLMSADIKTLLSRTATTCFPGADFLQRCLYVGINCLRKRRIGSAIQWFYRFHQCFVPDLCIPQVTERLLSISAGQPLHQRQQVVIGYSSHVLPPWMAIFPNTAALSCHCHYPDEIISPAGALCKWRAMASRLLRWDIDRRLTTPS